jgi:hypothetical protein
VSSLTDVDEDGNVTDVRIGRGPRSIRIEISWPEEEGYVDTALAVIAAAVAGGGVRLTFGGPAGFAIEAFTPREDA